jgi:hypothetical protein
MSQAEERSTTPQKDAYGAPRATVVGKVEELTAGNGGDIWDSGGSWMAVAFSGEEVQDGGDELGREADGDDEAGGPGLEEEE